MNSVISDTPGPDVVVNARAPFQPAPTTMIKFSGELKQSGSLVGAEGLAGPSQAKIVRAGGNGAPEVTDGPFAESKEFLAGYWIVDVDSPQEAYDIAARASAAPGPGGKPLNMPIEVREVMSGPPPTE